MSFDSRVQSATTSQYISTNFTLPQEVADIFYNHPFTVLSKLFGLHSSELRKCQKMPSPWPRNRWNIELVVTVATILLLRIRISNATSNDHFKCSLFICGLPIAAYHIGTSNRILNMNEERHEILTMC